MDKFNVLFSVKKFKYYLGKRGLYRFLYKILQIIFLIFIMIFIIFCWGDNEIIQPPIDKTLILRIIDLLIGKND